LTVTDLLSGTPSPGRLFQIPLTGLGPGFSQTVRASLLIGGAALHLPIILR
jgi:hypothetical protein